VALQSTAAAVVGGGVSEATGGKFGNGARTAGFGYLFNQFISDGGGFKTRAEAERHANELNKSGGKIRWTVQKTEDGTLTLQPIDLAAIEIAAGTAHTESIFNASSPAVCGIFCGAAASVGSALAGDHSSAANSDSLNVAQDIHTSSDRILDVLMRSDNSTISEFSRGLSRVSPHVRISLLLPAINNNFQGCYDTCTSNYLDR